MTYIFLFFALATKALAGAFYTDQKQNCSARVPGNYCYNGPVMDSVGQYLSCSVPGTIALTFDSGPSPYTSHILDVLKEHNMKATFFVRGTFIHEKHDIIQRIVDEGHQLGSHSYDNSYLDTSDASKAQQEMIEFETALVNEYFTGSLNNGSIPSYMSAPYGVLDATSYQVIYNQLGYLPIHWGLLTDDSDNTDGSDNITETSIVPRYQSRLGGPTGEGVNSSSLVLITRQHDTQLMTSDTFENLTTYLSNAFGSQGVKFVTIADCLGGTVPAYRPNPRLQSELLPPTNPPSSSNSFPIWAIVLIAVVGVAFISSIVMVIYRCCHNKNETIPNTPDTTNATTSPNTTNAIAPAPPPSSTSAFVSVSAVMSSCSDSVSSSSVSVSVSSSSESSVSVPVVMSSESSVSVPAVMSSESSVPIVSDPSVPVSVSA